MQRSSAWLIGLMIVVVLLLGGLMGELAGGGHRGSAPAWTPGISTVTKSPGASTPVATPAG